MCVFNISQEFVADKDFFVYKKVYKTDIYISQTVPGLRKKQDNFSQGKEIEYKLNEPTQSLFDNSPGLYVYQHNPIEDHEYFPALKCLVPKGTKFKTAITIDGVACFLVETLIPICEV